MDNLFDNNVDDIDKKFELLKSQALQFSDNEQFDRAVESYKEALKLKPNQVQVMGELCWCLGQIDKYDEMLEIAKKALLISQKRGSKDNIGRFYFYIAQVYKITKQYEKAIKFFTLAIANKPHFISNYLDMAYCYNMLGDYRQAINSYEQIKNIDAKYAKENNIQIIIDDVYEKLREQSPELMHIKLGIEYEKQGEDQLANKEYFQAVQCAPQKFTALFLLFRNEINLNDDKYKIIGIGESLIILLNNKENKDEASNLLEHIYACLAKLYEKIGNQEKSDDYTINCHCHSIINKAKEAFVKKEYEEALSLYKQALEIKDDILYIYDGIIDCCLWLNKLDDAIDYAVKGMKLAKSDNDRDYIAKYYYDLGCCYEILKYNKAVEYYEKALETTLDVDNKLKYCRKIAFFYSSNANLLKASSYFNKCLDYINDGAEDIYDINSDIIRLGEHLDKNSNLNKSAEHYNKGVTFFNEMNFEEAVNEMKIALSYIPQDVDTMDVLNRCLFKLKRYDECYEVAHEGFLICIRDRDYRFYDMFCYNIANCFYNRKNYESAVKYFKYALDAKPYDVDYLYFVGACYRNLGDFDKAIEMFQIAHKINPEDEGVIEQLAFCLGQLKK